LALPSPLPDWLFECRLTTFAGSDADTSAAVCHNSADLRSTEELAATLWRLEAQIYGEAQPNFESRQRGGPSDASGASMGTMGTTGTTGTMPAYCLARLALGACCEAYAVVAANRLSAAGETPPTSAADQQMLCRLYSDAALAAAWTSAHALHLTQLAQFGIASPPGLHTVACEASEMDLSDLYAHRTASSSLGVKDAGHVLALMTRCTNPGSRGWDSVVKDAVDKSPAARRIICNALTISLTGMHSSLHPAQRLHWKERHPLQKTLQRLLHHSEVASVVDKCIVEIKECMRRMTSNCTSTAYATMAALAYIDHPLALLQSCPFRLPPAGVEAAAVAYVRAGRSIAEDHGSADLSLAIRRAFSQQAAVADGHLAWRSSFLGKGTASVHNKIPALHMAQEVWTNAFRCNFIPFWAHSACHKLRASRLDAVQHASIHGMNSATRLTLLLSDEERMRLQRIALRNPASGIMTLKEVGTLLGIEGVHGSSCNGGSKGCRDAVQAVGGAGGMNAARLLSFCRSAWISEELLIYDLGPGTARAQTRALRQRLLLPLLPDDDPDLLRGVPMHSHSLCACVECKRVANAVVTDGGVKWANAFNELGTAGSMMSTNAETCQNELRCAKRASASLRTAIIYENQMSTCAVENEALNDESLHAMIANNAIGSESGASARARRDSKCAFQQRKVAVACGEEPMLNIPIIGRAVRLWHEWYALCSYCGCFVRFRPSNRAGVEICCMRCDYRMLHRTEPEPTSARSAASSVPQCRFCAKIDPQRSGVKWRMVRAPHDVSGTNATLPPPLRTVFFCPMHFRSWIPCAMKTMPTRTILSHIVFGARPLIDTAVEDASVREKRTLQTKSGKRGRAGQRAPKRKRTDE
tara:strand:+ start:6210 stop:8819 length:2610 start_codon:yes stop_codon:yes gene_type:complete